VGVAGFCGMATNYGEAVLAQTYKEEKDGEMTGGPVYYIRAAFPGLGGKVLSVFFAIMLIIALGFMGNMVQSNSIGVAFAEAFAVLDIHISPVIVTAVVAALAGFIFFGGTNRLASVLEKLVPIMAGIYILGSLTFIFMHITKLPEAFMQILIGAFDPQAIMGGAMGITVKEAIRYGVARGLFANEAGMGSTPHAHARAKVKTADEQGLCAMVSVFIDTYIILNLTVFVILTSGTLGSGATGINLTQGAFVSGFGQFGLFFVAFCLFFFAFSTVLGWQFFGAVNVEYLFGKKAVYVYSAIVVLCIVVGALLKVNLVWEMADFFNGLMIIPNVLALIKSVHVVRDTKVCSTYGEEAKETA